MEKYIPQIKLKWLMKQFNLFVIFVFIITMNSCKSLQPYELIYLNDSEMEMGADNPKNFENYVESIREVGNPTGGNKSNGGCGCN